MGRDGVAVALLTSRNLGALVAGKSTQLQSVFPDLPYLSFDDPEEVRAAGMDPRGFLSRFPKNVILDEAQRAPELFSYLKIAIDADRRKGLFILSLSRGLSEGLARRIGLLELHPFERQEMPKSGRKNQMRSVRPGPRSFPRG